MNSKTTADVQPHPREEDLSAFIDGMLDVAQIHTLGAHVSECAACAEALERLRETKTLLRQMPAPAPPPPEFWANSYRRLRIDAQQQAQARRPFWAILPGAPRSALPRPASHRWAAGLTAAALAGALIVGPLATDRWLAPVPPAAVAPVQDVSPDVLSLVEAHTDSVSQLPLADPDRQKMIAADVRQNPPESSADAPEASGYADIAY